MSPAKVLFSFCLAVLLSQYAVAKPSVEVFAGDGTTEYGGDGQLATQTGLNAPMGLALDAEGRVLISEGDTGRILRVTNDGKLVTVAGCGFPGFGGDGGPATEAFFSRPLGLAADATGSIFVADHLNHRIRRIDPDGVVKTIAGDGRGMFGLGDYGGDGGDARSASLNFPTNLLLLGNGGILIADQMNGRVRKVDPNGQISTLLGGEKTPQLALQKPSDLQLDPAGRVLIVDSGANRIWAASREKHFTLLLGRRPTSAFEPVFTNPLLLDVPVAVTTSPDGTLYWAESGANRVCRIAKDRDFEVLMKGPRRLKQRVSLQSSSDKPVLGSPADLLWLPDGGLLVADPGSHRVWKITGLE